MTMTRKREEILEDIARQVRRCIPPGDMEVGEDLADLKIMLRELDASGQIDGHALLAWFDCGECRPVTADGDRIKGIIKRKVREMMSEAE